MGHRYSLTAALGTNFALAIGLSALGVLACRRVESAR